MGALTYAKRIGLFLLTNILVVCVVSVLLKLLGIDHVMARRGFDFEQLMIFSLVWGFSGSLISLGISKFMAKMATGAKVIQTPQTEREAWLISTVQRLARQAGIGMPDVAIYPSPEVNAFATGARRNHALVAVSEGILDRMTREELEAVLAHELSHVANGDMVTMTLVQGVVNTFVIFFSRALAMLLSRGGERERRNDSGSWMIAQVLQMVLGVLAMPIVMAYSRHREFRADRGSAELNGSAPMIRALRRLESAHDGTILPASLRAFGIRGDGGILRLFRSHPTIEQRIARLEQFGGALR